VYDGTSIEVNTQLIQPA